MEQGSPGGQSTDSLANFAQKGCFACRNHEVLDDPWEEYSPYFERWRWRVRACTGSTGPSWSSELDSWGTRAFCLDHWLNVNYLKARWDDQMAVQCLLRCSIFQAADLALGRSLFSRAADKHSRHRSFLSLESASKHKDHGLSVSLAVQISSSRALASHIGIFSRLVCYSSSACEFSSWLCLKGSIAKCSTFLNCASFWSLSSSGSVLTPPASSSRKCHRTVLRRSLRYLLPHLCSVYFRVQACRIHRLAFEGYLGIGLEANWNQIFELGLICAAWSVSTVFSRWNCGRGRRRRMSYAWDQMTAASDRHNCHLSFVSKTLFWQPFYSSHHLYSYPNHLFYSVNYHLKLAYFVNFFRSFGIIIGLQYCCVTWRLFSYLCWKRHYFHRWLSTVLSYSGYYLHLSSLSSFCRFLAVLRPA